MIILASLAGRIIARLRLRLGQLGGGGSEAQAGSALVEFVFLAVLMMVPLFYLVMVLARLQAGAYGVSAAAREAGRAYVTAPSAAQAPTIALIGDLAFLHDAGSLLGAVTLDIDLAPLRTVIGALGESTAPRAKT